MNRVVLVGRLTKDPELRSTSTGLSTVNFSVAVSKNFKNKDGKYDADFINCVAFRQTADFVSKYFKKGSMISLDGKIQTRNYDAQDGTKRYVTEVLVDNVEFVGGKNDSSQADNSGYYPDTNMPDMESQVPDVEIPSSEPFENYDNEISLSDNDLPF